MFKKRVKHYHQWLRTAIPFKAKFGQISSDSVRVQGPAKRPSLGHLYPVSPVKERNRKGGKFKISRVLQSPVPSTQASPKVEANHRPQQAQHFSTRRKVQNGNSRVHQDLPDSWGVGIVDRSVGRLPTHPHPPKLKEIPKVLLQDSGVPIHLPPIRTSHSPPGLYNDCKGSETNGPLKRTQNSPIPGRLADQVPVSGGSPSEHSGGSRPNPVLGVDNKSGKIRTETYSGVFVRGLRIPSRFSPCKTHSRETAQTPGFDPTPQVKTCFDCKMFDVANWVASLNGENGPGGTPAHEALSVSSQGALEISSVAGQPPSLDRSHCSPPRLVAKSLKRDERYRPSSQRPQYPTLYRRLKRRLGCSLRPKFYKGSVVRSGKKATHKCPRIEGGLPGPSRLQGPVPEPNSVSCDRQLNSGSIHQQTRRNSLSRDVCSPVEDHDLVPSLSHNIKRSQSVSPVTIPALTTIVDRPFKEDRTLCPVRALRYYLDRTKDLRGSRSLLFISFKKGHTSDIRPATLSSWLKQTILLCYKQADQQALDLVQVKAHDIRAIAASKAFYGGVSVDQIMQACHWKAHNTFTNFYLKDLTWSDNDNNMYLGPVVAAQQVLDPSPQTSCPWKEKRGGGGGGAHPLQPSLQESLPGSRYSFTFKMLRVRSFCFLLIKYFVLRTYLVVINLIFRWQKLSNHWVGQSFVKVPQGP